MSLLVNCFLLNRRRVLVFASSGKWESPTVKGFLLGVRLLKKTVLRLWKVCCDVKYSWALASCECAGSDSVGHCKFYSVTSCHRILTRGNVKTVRRELLVVWMPFNSIVYASFTSLKSRFLVIKMNAINYKPN